MQSQIENFLIEFKNAFLSIIEKDYELFIHFINCSLFVYRVTTMEVFVSLNALSSLLFDASK